MSFLLLMMFFSFVFFVCYPIVFVTGVVAKLNGFYIS